MLRPCAVVALRAPYFSFRKVWSLKRRQVWQKGRLGTFCQNRSTPRWRVYVHQNDVSERTRRSRCRSAPDGRKAARSSTRWNRSLRLSAPKGPSRMGHRSPQQRDHLTGHPQPRWYGPRRDVTPRPDQPFKDIGREESESGRASLKKYPSHLGGTGSSTDETKINFEARRESAPGPFDQNAKFRASSAAKG